MNSEQKTAVKVDEVDEELAMTAFVVNQAGDAPVKVNEIVTADMHAELSIGYAITGYVATPVTINERALVRIYDKVYANPLFA
jgi:hypothetical protein